MVKHRPIRRLLLITGIILLSVGCIVVGYALGQNTMVAERVSNTLLSRDLGAAETQVTTLESRLIDAELAAQVQRDANDALRDDLSELHSEIHRLNEEVTFYKSLMAPGEIQQGLKVAEMELQQHDDGSHGFQLLLTQVALRRNYISGEVRVDFIGSENGAQVVKSLTELQESGDYPLRFRFRYFQDLTGQFTLPDGFVAEKILITAIQNGRDAESESFQATFPWPQY